MSTCNRPVRKVEASNRLASVSTSSRGWRFQAAGVISLLQWKKNTLDSMFYNIIFICSFFLTLMSSFLARVAGKGKDTAQNKTTWPNSWGLSDCISVIAAFLLRLSQTVLLRKYRDHHMNAEQPWRTLMVNWPTQGSNASQPDIHDAAYLFFMSTNIIVNSGCYEYQWIMILSRRKPQLLVITSARDSISYLEHRVSWSLHFDLRGVTFELLHRYCTHLL